MAEEQIIEHIIDLSTGTGAEVVLDGPELAAVLQMREAVAQQQVEDDKRAEALLRLREDALTNSRTYDLLNILGLL
jgi:leucyl aminopeptidase